MITPAHSFTATERVLPRLALDFTTGVLDPRVTVARALDTATRVNSSGFIEAVNANLPRFDYDPTTLALKGLLIEETRSNALIYSEQFDNPAWSTTGILAFGSGSVVNAINGPNNTLTADLITPSTGNTAHRIFQNTTFLSNTASSFSIFVKANGYTKVGIRESNASGAGAAFDLSNGTVIGAYNASGSTVSNMSITAFPNGWYRISCTISFASATIMRFGFHVLSPSYAAGGDLFASWVPNGVNGVYVLGSQLEAGTFATSYIPTTTTSLTRNADVVSMTGTNFSSWYNASEGTFYNEVLLIGFSGAGRFGINVSDGTSSNRIMQYLDAVTALNGRYTTSGVNVTLGKTGISNMTVTPGKSVQAYKANSFAFAVNGSTVETSSSGSVPTVNTAYFNSIETGAATNMASGWLRKVLYWPQRLINAEVQAFSK